MNIDRLLKKWERELGRMTFASTLRSWRKCEEESMSEFADRLGVSKSSLQQLESGKRIPAPKRAAQIAKKLGLPESSLIELSLRDSLYANGLKYNVKLESA